MASHLVFDQRLGGGLGVVQVAQHHGRRGDLDLALGISREDVTLWVDHADPGSREGLTDRADPAGRAAVDRDDRGGLSQAVALEEGAVGPRLSHPLVPLVEEGAGRLVRTDGGAWGR